MGCARDQIMLMERSTNPSTRPTGQGRGGEYLTVLLALEVRSVLSI
jgi:hypothetical protein